MEVGALRSGDPERLGSYALTGRVGEGGQGTVFLGEDESGRQVAVKLLHAELTSDDKARARFLRELEVAKQVAPFCTAQVIDADATGDRPYIVSEYVPGPSLNQYVTQAGPLDGAALDRLAVGTATALAAIHQAKIIHRDFKPHNVLIGPDGPRVIDFGVARAISGSTTLTSRVIGTPSYMAPEQIQGEEVGTAADVFCWAATLVFAATGEPPFGQDTIPAVINRILHDEPELGDLNGPLRELVTACLNKDPAQRPVARQVLMRLLGHEDAAPVSEIAPPADDPDETAMLAAGSVLAAEAADGHPHTAGGPSRADDGRPHTEKAGAGAFNSAGRDVPDTTQAAAGRLPTPAEWAAGNTLPPNLAPEKRSLIKGVAGSGRSAVLAGAAALVAVIVVVSAVLALSSGDKGKAGQKVSDPSASPGTSEAAPNSTAPRTRAPIEQEPESSSSPSQTPTLSPSGSPSPSSSPSPSEPPTDPTPTRSTESPDPSPDASPSTPGTATPGGSGSGGKNPAPPG